MASPLIAPAARADLRDIRRYSTAAFGQAVTLAYLQGLRTAFLLLQDHPHAGALETDLGTDVRGFSHRSHRIYYREQDGEVTIVRVLHHARNAGQALGEQ